MPLNELNDTQKQIIRELIDDQIDFPLEEKPLRETLAQLTLALSGEALPPSHPYLQLQKCYLTPTACFFQLESNSQFAISIGSVQEYILDCLDESVRKAIPAHQAFSDWGWSSEGYRSHINFSPPFVSLPCNYTSHPSWQMPDTPEKMYRIHLTQEREDRRCRASVQLHLPDYNFGEDCFFLYPEDTHTAFGQDRFVYENHSLIQDTVEIKVVDFLFLYLKERGIIDPRQLGDASQTLKNLILYRIYFNALLTRKIHFQNLLSFNMDQLALLADPTIRAFIEARKCDLDQAVNLLPQEYTVATHPYYSQLILQGLLSLKEFKGICPEQVTLLTLPGVIYLHQKGLIIFLMARDFPLSATPIFKSEPCLEMLVKRKLFLKDLGTLSPKQACLLANSYYAGEYQNNRLGLNELRSWSDEQIDQLLLPIMIQLQQKQGLHRLAALKASPHTVQLLQDPDYAWLALVNELAFSYIESLKPYQVGILLNPAIKALILNGKLKIARAIRLNEHEMTLIKKPQILTLMQADKIRVEELREIPILFADLFGYNSFASDLILRNLLTFQDCLTVYLQATPKNPHSIQMGLIFGCRLVALLKGRVYIHPEGTPDTLEHLRMELATLVATDPHYHREEICDHSLALFFRVFHQSLILEKKQSQNIHSSYSSLLSQLTYPIEGSGDYLSELEAFVREAGIKATGFRFFRNSARSDLSGSLFMQTPAGKHAQEIRQFLAFLEKAQNLAHSFKEKPQKKAAYRRVGG